MIALSYYGSRRSTIAAIRSVPTPGGKRSHDVRETPRFSARNAMAPSGSSHRPARRLNALSNDVLGQVVGALEAAGRR